MRSSLAILLLVLAVVTGCETTPDPDPPPDRRRAAAGPPQGRRLYPAARAAGRAYVRDVVLAKPGPERRRRLALIRDLVELQHSDLWDHPALEDDALAVAHARRSAPTGLELRGWLAGVRFGAGIERGLPEED